MLQSAKCSQNTYEDLSLAPPPGPVTPDHEDKNPKSALKGTSATTPQTAAQGPRHPSPKSRLGQQVTDLQISIDNRGPDKHHPILDLITCCQ